MDRDYDGTLSELFESTDDSLSDIRRFPKGMHYDTKLALCLTGGKLPLLLDDCLLSKRIQSEHADSVLEKFKNKLKNSRAPGQGAEELFCNFRFLTILDSVVPLTKTSAIDQIKSFKKKLKKFFGAYRSLWVVGAIEVEIVNMSGMRLLQTIENAEGMRKLKTCEQLFNLWVKPEDRNNDSYALIHFHGLMFHRSENELHAINCDLKRKSEWSKIDYQTMMKRLSREYEGRIKPLTLSLEHIARYIVKGGTDRVGKYVYLRYKHNYSNGSIPNDLSELESDLKSDIISEVKDDYSNWDHMSLTYGETIFLAQLTHSMMYMNRAPKTDKNRGKGYLIILENRPGRASKRKKRK